MLSVGFEPVLPAIEQLQTYALDRISTRIGKKNPNNPNYLWLLHASHIWYSSCHHVPYFESAHFVPTRNFRTFRHVELMSSHITSLHCHCLGILYTK